MNNDLVLGEFGRYSELNDRSDKNQYNMLYWSPEYKQHKGSIGSFEFDFSFDIW